MVLLQAPDLVKAYPPFVNFFENTKEMLVKCDQTKPRFHAFLKICQTKPECGRQSLQELLIRPVQRLPSISLLLSGKCYAEGQRKDVVVESPTLMSALYLTSECAMKCSFQQLFFKAAHEERCY